MTTMTTDINLGGEVAALRHIVRTLALRPVTWQPEGIYADAYRRAMDRTPIVVPETTDCDEANLTYGESYGVDWIYEDFKKPAADG